MTEITNTIPIHGPLAAVFDLVTTTRFWPQWHPATIGVGGVTERPFQQGDKIRERARIGAHTYEGAWTVTEHARPTHAVLLGESGRIQIRYVFQQVGDEVTYSRTLAYHPEDFAASAGDPARLAQLMYTQSEQALQKLKALVEQILVDEARVAIRE
ncbi:MAG: SRPBCC family protein [Caldilineaceae bacterium]